MNKILENQFELDLAKLINSYSREGESNTPDFLLASYMRQCLDAFNNITKARDAWYDVALSPGKKV